MIKSEIGMIIEDSDDITLVALCRDCSLPAETIINMVDRGIIEPLNPTIRVSHWQFSSNSLLRVKTALRLQQDLEVNLAGAALALELLDEIKQLRQQLAF